jgi:transcription elongation factor Elf1
MNTEIITEFTCPHCGHSAGHQHDPTELNDENDAITVYCYACDGRFILVFDGGKNLIGVEKA